MDHGGNRLAEATAVSMLRESAKIDIVSLASVMGHVKSGKLKAMAVVEAQRYKGMPEIPTIKETVPTSWLGFFAPAGTPPQTISRSNAEINRALADPELAASLESRALVRLSTTPEQFTRMVKKELELGARFAKMFGVKP